MMYWVKNVLEGPKMWITFDEVVDRLEHVTEKLTERKKMV